MALMMARAIRHDRPTYKLKSVGHDFRNGWSVDLGKFAM